LSRLRYWLLFYRWLLLCRWLFRFACWLDFRLSSSLLCALGSLLLSFILTHDVTLLSMLFD
jgi:hypothetical protein